MSLNSSKLQIVDSCTALLIDKTTSKTMMNGYTTKASLDAKSEAIPIFAGIGQQKLAVLRSKREFTLDINLAQFDLDFLASINGVPQNIDTAGTTSTYYLSKTVTVATQTATVTGATRIFAVQKLDGTFLTIVSTTPADVTEVKVSGTTLTFHTSFTDTSVLVSYEAPATASKDNRTIVLNSKSFPKNAELILQTVAYDTDTEAIVADVYVHLYKTAIAPDFTWAFEMGKAVSTDVKIDVLVPSLLPNGTSNIAGDIGKLVVTER